MFGRCYLHLMIHIAILMATEPSVTSSQAERGEEEGLLRTAPFHHTLYEERLIHRVSQCLVFNIRSFGLIDLRDGHNSTHIRFCRDTILILRILGGVLGDYIPLWNLGGLCYVLWCGIFAAHRLYV